ncbi:hypothetical protein LPYR103PRE_14790 [Segatella asaccharophila]|jgi:agmatine/peptidylarginine deiminase
MFQEQYKDTVYFSDTLKADYPAVYQKITALLDKNHVCHSFLKGTEDYWCRDYMPVQCGYNQFIQFRYHPDYLEKVRDKETSTKTAITLSVKATGVSPKVSTLIADGGNFTASVTRQGQPAIVMRNKIFSENQQKSHKEILSELHELFHDTKIIFLPWKPNVSGDECGHTDGILRPISDGKILVDLDIYPKKMARDMRTVLEKDFELVDLDCTEDGGWAYINMLQTRDIIIVPGLGIPSDEKAFNQIKSLYPSYAEHIYQVNIGKIVSKWNGALNCLSWTVGHDRSATMIRDS